MSQLVATRLSRSAQAMLALAGLIGLLALVGHLYDLPALVRVRPGLRGMSPLTATAIVLLALGARFLEHPRRWAAVSPCIAGLLGAGALVSQVLARDDRLTPGLYALLGHVAPPGTGRVSAATASCVVLLSLAMLLQRRRRMLSDGLAGVSLAIATTAALGYLYGVDGLYAVYFFNSVAVNTAAALWLLSLATLLANPRAGWAAVLTSSTLGGKATRRQLAFVSLPTVVGWLVLSAIDRGGLQVATAMAILVVATIGPLAFLVLRDGRALVSIEVERAEKTALQSELAAALKVRLERQSVLLQAESARLAQAEESVRQAQRLEAVGQLTGGIAHDFNNLLQAISGNLQLLRRRMAADDPSRRFVESAATAVSRGAKVTAQLLAFSRSQRLTIAPLDVARALTSAHELFRHALPPGITVEVVPPADALWASGDETQLELALVNLAMNARDAMPGGGHLRISAERSDAMVALGDVAEARQMAVITVADTGTGMSPEVLQRAAEPFFTTKAQNRGTGLGLAQVYGFSRQCGGDTRLASELGHGTRIDILLPVAEAPASVPAQGSERTLAAPDTLRQSRCVLVVDDDDGIREVVVHALAAAGFDVAQAADGQAALAWMETARPDIAVIDFLMPGMNGAEVARRAQARHPGLGIVFVSGYADTVALDGIPGAAVLRKPFDMDVLHSTLLTMLTPSGRLH